MCYVKGVAHVKEPTENYYQLCNASEHSGPFKPLLGHCFGCRAFAVSLSPLSLVATGSFQ